MGLSLESEWRQVSSGLQDSSQYSSRFQRCSDGFDSLIFSPILPVPSPGTIPSILTVGITLALMFHTFFSFLARYKYYYYYHCYFTHSWGVFHISVNRLFFTGMTATPLKSPELSTVFWPISTMDELVYFSDFSPIIIIIIIIIIIYSLEFFTSALADGLSLEFECQQVSSSLQDSSQYSGRSQ